MALAPHAFVHHEKSLLADHHSIAVRKANHSKLSGKDGISPARWTGQRQVAVQFCLMKLIIVKDRVLRRPGFRFSIPFSVVSVDEDRIF